MKALKTIAQSFVLSVVAVIILLNSAPSKSVAKTQVPHTSVAQVTH